MAGEEKIKTTAIATAWGTIIIFETINPFPKVNKAKLR